MPLSVPFCSSSAVLILWIATAWRGLAKRIKGFWPWWRHESLAPDHNTTDNPSCATELAQDKTHHCLPPNHSLFIFYFKLLYLALCYSQCLSAWIPFWLSWADIVIRAWPQRKSWAHETQTAGKTTTRIQLLVSSSLDVFLNCKHTFKTATNYRVWYWLFNCITLSKKLKFCKCSNHTTEVFNSTTWKS